MPVLLQETIDGNGELVVWHVTESTEELIALLRKQRIYVDIPFFRNPSRLAEWLAARAIFAQLGVKQRIVYDEMGKPHLEGEGQFVSISHSGEFVAVIFHPKCRVGVDIERMGDRIHKVSHKFVNDKELSWIPEVENTAHFYIIWGAKECAFKIYGLGSVDFRDHLEVKPFELSRKGVTTVAFKKGENDCEYRVFFQSLGNVMVTYAIAP